MQEAGRETPRTADKAKPVPKLVGAGDIVLRELRLFTRRVAEDDRGAFSEMWRNNAAREFGLPPFVQDNIARSVRGVVRGLHFQNPRGQAKLVSVAFGEIFDVAVDVRVGSSTFGRWSGCTLSESNGAQLFIPPGFAHGYQTISDVSVVMYKCSNYYAPDDERTVRWDDESIGVDWPIDAAVVSERDATAPLLRELLSDALPQLDR